MSGETVRCRRQLFLLLQVGWTIILKWLEVSLLHFWVLSGNTLQLLQIFECTYQTISSFRRPHRSTLITDTLSSLTCCVPLHQRTIDQHILSGGKYLWRFGNYYITVHQNTLPAHLSLRRYLIPYINNALDCLCWRLVIILKVGLLF